jgi:RNA polymerase sigma-70 factor, ECF subfamily
MMKLAPKRPRVAIEGDAELLRAIAEGDLGSLGVLFDRHHESVRQFLLRVAPASGDIDDLVQETFLTVTRAAGSYDGRACARAFLIGIAAQLLRRRHRSVGRYRGLLQRFGLVAPTPPRTPEQSTMIAEHCSCLHEAIDRLSEELRLALVLVEWGGMTGPEVAESLGIPVGTVWRRLHDARSELRSALARGDE